jgi:hypothetical protein
MRQTSSKLDSLRCCRLASSTDRNNAIGVFWLERVDAEAVVGRKTDLPVSTESALTAI